MRQHSARQRDRTDHILKIHDPAPAPALIEERIGDVLDELGTAIISRSREPVRDRARRAIARPRALLVLAAGVALTGGATWVISQQAPSGSPCPPGSGRRGCAILDSTGALHGWFAMSAFCAWVIDWRQATLAGDRARAGRDARTIMAAPRWKAVTAEDPHPRAPAGGRWRGLFGWMLPYAAAVGAGDLARVDQLLSSNLYGGQFMSYDPGAVRWMEHAETHRWPQGHPTDLDYLHATAR